MQTHVLRLGHYLPVADRMVLPPLVWLTDEQLTTLFPSRCHRDAEAP